MADDKDRKDDDETELDGSTETGEGESAEAEAKTTPTTSENASDDSDVEDEASDAESADEDDSDEDDSDEDDDGDAPSDTDEDEAAAASTDSDAGDTHDGDENASDSGGAEELPAPAGPEGAGDRVPALYLAEFDTPKDIMHAAEKVRDAGFKYWDVHTPFPVHGMDDAMGLGQSHLGWISLVMGVTGTFGAFAMMYWMNGIDYPLIIGGKPPGAVISMIPILFECTVLLCGLGTVFGMLGLNKLPRHHHPVFYSERFERASDDKFFLSIEAQDPKFDLEETRELLETLHPTHVELVEEEIEP